MSVESSTMTSYDELPYPLYTFPATHIARLGATARIFGCDAVEPRQARVLELACAQGANLMAMAQLFPEAEFVGVDASRKQIDEGHDILRDTGLTNVHLIAGDLSKLEEPLGEFDYIITHGLFSWVPHEVQEAVLRIYQQNLKPHGVGYISYNCLPGWRMRGALRDMMLMHTAGLTDTKEKVAQAKALIKFLSEACGQDSAYGKYLGGELNLLAACDDSYIAHEFLEEANEPFYFTDFLKRLVPFQLQYLGEADPASMVVENLPDKAAQTLKSLKLTQVALEQYMDFVRNRTFRTTLVCHAAVPLNRNVEPSRLEGLMVAPLVTLKSEPTPENPVAVFAGAGTMEFTVNTPATIKLFTKLAARGARATDPRSLARDVAAELPPEDVAAAGGEDPVVEQLVTMLLQGYFRKIVDITLGPLSVRTPTGEEAEILPLARWQAAHNSRISTSRLEMLNADAFTRQVLILADGTRNREELIGALIAANARQDFVVREGETPLTDPDKLRLAIGQLLDVALERLGNAGLLLSATPTTGQPFEPEILPPPEEPPTA